MLIAAKCQKCLEELHLVRFKRSRFDFLAVVLRPIQQRTVLHHVLVGQMPPLSLQLLEEVVGVVHLGGEVEVGAGCFKAVLRHCGIFFGAEGGKTLNVVGEGAVVTR